MVIGQCSARRRFGQASKAESVQNLLKMALKNSQMVSVWRLGRRCDGRRRDARRAACEASYVDLTPEL